MAHAAPRSDTISAVALAAAEGARDWRCVGFAEFRRGALRRSAVCGGAGRCSTGKAQPAHKLSASDLLANQRIYLHWPLHSDLVARRIAGRPADFFKIAPGPILGPWGGQNRIPREKIFRFHLFTLLFDRFLKNQKFRKIDFSHIDYFCNFYRYFDAWEHQNRTRHEKNTSGVLF